ncbi:radical SAM protein [Methanoregula sp.]|uniref:radical SAM protein n=1 Tax=Methanoregula sp. TaxID=2052170 RepID=UPI00236D4EBC|nr:radical SAM protein [Methanoregula sp.]MDD1686672.1 radical SAM protein [Methanoregula sp.]
MQWKELKARLLGIGSANLTGEPADRFIAKSAAGPGAGGRGAIFFGMGSHRVKLALNPASTVEIAHRGNGAADLYFGGKLIPGRLIEPGLHCPDQAFITVTGSCIFRCRYCTVPRIGGKRKSIEEIMGMVESVQHRIHAISITSGVLKSIEDEEAYVLEVIRHLSFFGMPIGVSIYPSDKTPDRLKQSGVAEVKFNIEAATPELFAKMCPGLDYEQIWSALDRSVELFGKNRVFSNVIVGLGETDEELEACIRKLASHGVIPVLRPLNPVAELTGTPRPSAERLKKIFSLHEQALAESGLDACEAMTMCTSCAGCDLVPGRDE